jgi:hypothetical protein
MISMSTIQSDVSHPDFDIRRLLAEPAAVAWAFVALGLSLRLSRYLLHFPLWGDEHMLAVQFLDRGYGDLLRPLDFGQVCPLLFLWVELSVVKLLGFNEWSLRLLPTVCSLASVLVFRNLAARSLHGWPQTLAIAVFAVSYYPIRHGAEAKPYAGDLLCSLVLLSLAASWLDQPQRAVRLWALAAAAPLCVGFSFTAAFVAGGVALTLLPSVWRQKRPALWLAYAACGIGLLITFGLLYWVHLRPILAATNKDLVGNQWSTAFPPLAEPLRLVVWLVQEHAGRMMAYPLGGERGGSAATLLLCLVALGVLWRERRRQLVALALMPFALGLLAAAMRKYPYGDSARTMQYIAPAVCLLTGLGLSSLITWCPGAIHKRRLLVGSLSLLAVIGGGLLIKDLARPYKHEHDFVNREFARWFWRDNAVGAELVCAERDLGLDYRRLGRCYSSPEFHCNQRIYSTSGRGQPPRWDRISAEHPLRIVLHCVEGDKRNPEFLRAWLDEIQSAHSLALVDVESYRLNIGSDNHCGRLIEVFELIPHGSAQAARPSWPARLR